MWIWRNYWISKLFVIIKQFKLFISIMIHAVAEKKAVQKMPIRIATRNMSLMNMPIIPMTM
ncbi:hypothetical protein D3C76_1652580 [compost metagenome]